MLAMTQTMKFLARSGSSASYFKTPDAPVSPDGFSSYSEFDDNATAWSPPRRTQPLTPYLQEEELEGLGSSQRQRLARRRQLAALAQPRYIQDKVETDGSVPGQLELAIRRARELPGVGDYDDGASFRSLSSTGTVGRPPVDPTGGGGRFGAAAKALREAAALPGPASYFPNCTSLPDRRGFVPGCGASTRISGAADSGPPSEIELRMAHAARLPGPSHYHPRDKGSKSGVKFGASTAKSDLEWTIHRAQQMPGPGAHDAAASPQRGGGRFNTANSKSSLEWTIWRAKQLPGPADYDPPKATPTSGGTISPTSPPSFLDAAVKKAAASPGAGDHDPNINLRFRNPGSGKFLMTKKQRRPRAAKAALGVYFIQSALSDLRKEGSSRSRR